MALALNDRVQQTGTANTTVSFTLSGSVAGFQSFAVVGDGNTTYYAATDASGNWEVGVGTYSTTGPTLARTTILSSSNSGAAVTFSGTVNVFVTYPAEKSVNLNADDVMEVGTPINYSDTGIIATFASSVAGYNQVVFQNTDSGTSSSSNINVSHNSATSTTGFAELGINSTTFTGSGSFSIAGAAYLASAGTDLAIGTYGAYDLHFVTNSSATDAMTVFDDGGVSLGGLGNPGLGSVAGTKFVPSYTSIVSAAGTTILTAASSYYQRVTGTSTQTIQMPDATTLLVGTTFAIDNDSTQDISITNGATTVIDTTASGSFAYMYLISNATVAGTWARYHYLPNSYDFGTNSATFGGATISNAVWNGTAISSAYGGTGLSGATPFTGANNALYSTSSSALAAGTLPVAAGGTGQTTASAAFNALSPITTAGDLIIGNGANSATRLPIGANTYVLTSNGTTATWAAAGGGSSTAITQNDTNTTVADSLTTITASIASASAQFTATLSGTTMTVVTVVSGTLAVGMVVTGSGIPFSAVYITALGTGTGGAGTYTLSNTCLGTTNARFFSGALGTMTVTAVTTGSLAVGDYISVSSTTSGTPVQPNTQILALGTGTGGTGTYFLNFAQTVASTTMYVGGTVTTTVDNYETSKYGGGNLFIRNTPIYEDTQGSVLSKRMAGTYASRTAGSSAAPLFFMAYNGVNQVTAAGATTVQKIASSTSPSSFINAPPTAFGSSFGSKVFPVGVTFITGTAADVQQVGLGGTSARWTDSVNAAVFGYNFNGPRVTTQNRRISNDLIPNTLDLVADHVCVGSSTSAASWGMPAPTTYTTATVGIADNTSNAIINFAGTVTVNLGGTNGNGAGSYFVATWDNGAGAAGTTLNVTSIDTGTPLYVGCRVFVGYGNVNDGVTRQVKITALGTGTGGTGTYTVASSAYFPSCEMSTPTIPTGKLLYIKTITNNAVNASAACVIPLTGGAAGTAILPATAGKWALLQYNGTNWEILQSN